MGSEMCIRDSFVSSKRRGLEARNFAVISIFILFTTYDKPALQSKRVGVYEWLFWPEKFSGLSRNGPLEGVEY